MKTTQKIEKYELKISSVMNEIGQIQKDLVKMNGIKSFSSVNPKKLKLALVKIQIAHKSLYDAIGLLVESGNSVSRNLDAGKTGLFNQG